MSGRQYDRPGQPWHGTFPVFEHDPEPGDDAIMWYSYDPNWRQFVGIALALIIQEHGERLPTKTLRSCESSVVRCVEGEPPGRIAPSYTNPALMHAWLATWVGGRFDLPALTRQGRELADQVMALFELNGTINEFNSPTYYGVDLVAAVLWTTADEPLKSGGRQLVGRLFDELRFLYHPALHNLCGPFSRVYNMDLRAEVSLYGLWRLLALGDIEALPVLEGVIPHSHDLFFAPLVEWAIRAAPLQFPRDEPTFPRRSSFRLPDARSAQCLLCPTFMLGAERGGRQDLVWEQYAPGALHWLERDGLKWLWVSARANSPVDCDLVEQGTLLATPAPNGSRPIRLRTNAGWRQPEANVVRLDSRVRVRSERPLMATEGQDGSVVIRATDPDQAVIVEVDWPRTVTGDRRTATAHRRPLTAPIHDAHAPMRESSDPLSGRTG